MEWMRRYHRDIKAPLLLPLTLLKMRGTYSDNTPPFFNKLEI